MRQQLDSVLQQKVAYPRMELYNPLQYQASALPTSQLIQAIIDLITREDYSDQVGHYGWITRWQSVLSMCLYTIVMIFGVVRDVISCN